MPDTLDDIQIPLAELRAEIVQLMKDGVAELPLTNVLYLLREIHRENIKSGK